jgi:hypothetical protein
MIEWKWLGGAEFVPGVPARDLEKGEAERRGILHLVEESPLYEKVTKPKVAKSKEGDK